MKALKVIGITVGVLIVIGVVGFLFMRSNAQKGLDALVYDAIDMTAVADGTYEGEADAGVVFARVSVTISGHAITDIDILEHRTGLGQKAETITTAMIAANTYDVDVVSGATNSSKTIMSAVSSALSKGLG